MAVAIVTWSCATGSHYSTEFSVQNGGGNSPVMGAAVAPNGVHTECT